MTKHQYPTKHESQQVRRADSFVPNVPASFTSYLALIFVLVTWNVAVGPVQGQTFGCSPAMANAVVCENSKLGNPSTEWDVNGAGDSTIQGFATDISVNQGQTARFKVNTTASAYRVDIYRLGYYGGLGARKVATVQPSVTLPQNQPSCLNDVSTGLVDCGNWAQSASWAVPANATSGIYLARLVRTNTGGASHIVFIVRADTSTSAMLFQSSDTTWQAYNSYGGNSFYTGSPAGRAFKLSYNRPFNTRAVNSGQSYLFNAEYPMIRWLEKNGYDLSYASGVDTDRSGGQLLNHKVFLSVGHDEYWSGAQRTNVEAARAAHVNLAFFSGNEIFWKTRWENSIDGSNTPYRTLVCYKETHANQPIDPQDPTTWTGTWRDPRFSPPADGGRPENALTGTIFAVNGPRNDAITVPAAYGKLRFWRNTSIATLPANGIATLPVGTLGYEWDVDADNGFRPAGLFDMSSTTLDVSGYYLVDYGSTFGVGTATHSLTFYRSGSGALVFGAGTVQWSWGLDGNHDNGNASPDSNMLQATVNLFADMGVQPATLQSGLLPATSSTDTSPPTSLITAPTSGSNVPIGTPRTISGTALDAGGGVVAGVEVSTDGGASWHPASGTTSWTYTWTPGALGSPTLKSRAVDDSGNLETPSPGITVTVIPDTTPPIFSNVQTAVVTSVWATITWNTNKPADSQVNYGTTTAYGASTQLDSTLVSNHAQTLNGLSPNTLYHFQVRGRDQYGNLGISGDFTFTTGATNSTTTITFDARPAGTFLSGQYPTGLIDWGNGSWFVSGPFGAFTGNSISFKDSSVFSASFSFVTPLRLLTIDAYNGGTIASTITLSCPGQINKQVIVAVSQLLTIATGWVGTCSPVTVGSTNGWDTNFNRLVVDSPAPTPPVISGVAAGQISCAGAAITWNTDKLADSQVEYGTSTAYGSSTAINTAQVIAHSVTLSGLSPNTLYHYRVKSRDASGNLGVSGDFTFSSSPNNGVPPTISAVQAVAVSNTSVYITWNTSAAVSSQVEYGTTAAYGTSTPVDSTPVTNHSVQLNGLTPGSIYHYRVKSGDQCGNLATSPDFTFSTSSTPPNNIWASTVTPSVTSNSDTAAIEVGVKLRSDVDGFITGVRFYKGSINTGSHVGNLWAINGTTGTLLASATFTNETTTGWQQVSFSAPVFITANTVYVASYHTNAGGYAINQGYFASAGVDNAPLHALKDGVSGANGVYIYSAPSAYPTQTFGSSNYWVDVAFVPAYDAVPPVISAIQAGTVTCGGLTITWTTDKASDSTVEYGATTAYGSSVVNAALVTSHSISLAGLTPNTLYHYRVKSKSSPINTAASVDFTFSTPASDGIVPTISGVQPVAVTNSSGYITWTTNKPTSSQVDYGLTTSYGTTTLNPTLVTSHTVLLTGLAPNTLYHYQVKSVDPCGAIVTSGDFLFTTSGAAPNTIWSSATTPAILSQADSAAIEVGVKFRSDASGYITGVRFYKGTANTGTHIGNLWTSTGTLLATATFTNETASGWQQVVFSAPVAISANTVYVASYYAPSGGYSLNQNYFAGTGFDNAPLHALQDGVSGGNGVYLYNPASAFPVNTFGSSNYWVDLLFSASGPATISSLSLNPTSVTGGTASTGTVTLSDVAPTGGAVVNLSSGNTAAATVPANVTVLAGASTATFTVSTVAVAASTPVTISATYNSVTQTGSLTVLPPAATPSSVTLNPTSVTGGTASTGTVTLSGAALTGGAVVNLSSSNTAATVPGTVTVLAGASTATFTVSTVAVAASTPVTVSATYNSVTKTGSLTVSPPAVTSVTLNPASVTGGTASTGTVTLSGAAPTGGAVVNLSSSNRAAATVPGTVTGLAGASTAAFTISTVTVAASTPVTISATYNSVTQTGSLTVLPPAVTLSSVTVNPTSFTLTAPGGTRQLTVTATYSNGSTQNVTNNAATSYVSNNTAAATGLVTAVANGTATITASHGGFSSNATATVNTTPGLVAAYNFNEGSGSAVADASGNGNTGTISGATWTTGGRFGGALSFNGSTSWVTVNDAASLHLTTGVTLEAWVKISALAGWEAAIIKETPGGLSYAVYANTDQNLPAGVIHTSVDINMYGAPKFL